MVDEEVAALGALLLRGGPVGHDGLRQLLVVDGRLVAEPADGVLRQVLLQLRVDAVGGDDRVLGQAAVGVNVVGGVLGGAWEAGHGGREDSGRVGGGACLLLAAVDRGGRH